MTEDGTGNITILAIYIPSKQLTRNNTWSSLISWVNDLSLPEIITQNIPIGNQNCIQTKGRELLKAIHWEWKLYQQGNLYWPSDKRKIPDLSDFAIAKGISKTRFLIESCLELSSDHSPVMISVSNKVINKKDPCKLYNSKTNWPSFRE